MCHGSLSYVELNDEGSLPYTTVRFACLLHPRSKGLHSYRGEEREKGIHSREEEDEEEYTWSDY